jgi:tetratricopeptide (TPR) repeat protein
LALENYDSALVYFNKAEQLDSTSYPAAHGLGIVYHAKQQFDSAIVYLQKCILLNPERDKNYFDLACSYAMNNQPDKAILNLNMAYEQGYKNKNALLTDPDLEGLKEIKAFQDILDKYVPGWRNR